MKTPGPVRHSRRLLLLAALTAASAAALADEGEFRLTVRSTTFVNNGTVPLSMVDSFVAPGSTVSTCTVSGVPGGNQSPELSWSGAPRNTRSFVVVAYDVTAAFTHWGIYNIAADATGLPGNAGVAGSSYGEQTLNDFFTPGYEGPCPPMSVAPDVHHYRFTVYALATRLSLPSSANFPATGETLYNALLEASDRGRVLASASITGLYSSTPP
jgi:Raf kinase inhibitor-like YbhB/YbcL family protein